MTGLAARLARRSDTLPGSIIDSSTALLAKQEHDIVRFAMGAPNADLIPQDAFDACFQAPGAGRYDYGATEGESRLIEQVLAIAERSGEPSTAERILITTGGMQGLDLAFKMLVTPGDLVIVEGPTYTNGNSTALSYGAELLEAPTDEHGLVVEALPELVRRAGRTPAAIYVIPNFQNPTGTTLSAERRRHLLELAEQWDCAIIDDDPYGLLRFSGDHEPSFGELSPANPRV
ncbi:PLP-dependent aminotransferase family protein, partial [Leucobacter sp. M11]|uniref:PLP-dependent aminotransferase family protein n=1 Tax=Leucobacter sp. M11 TaxID=2993565 RepID=UPI002D7F10A1